MGESDVELIRRIYGFDWVGVGSRREGFARLAELVAPDFHSRLSPELGERVVRGVEGLEEFTQALEQDFSEFRYEPDEFIDAGEGIVVAMGWIHAQGRYSRMPLSGEFGHVWALRQGKATTVTAYRDRESAKRGAGLA
jgi:ketosteroid isomerase-like protein